MNYYLHILVDNYNNGYFSLLLDMLSFISIILAILVITTKNPVISVLFLIGLFISIAGYLISTGVTFIGISYLLVYVGAVSILFLFILMLINIRVSELITETKNSIPLVFLVGLIFEIAYNIIFPQENLLHDSFINLFILNIITYNNWENTLAEFNHITSIGNIMYTNYSILLLLTSIILLLAMVGAIVITIKQKTTSYEEKATDVDSCKLDSHTNLSLQSNISLYIQEFINLLVKFVKYLTILSIKLFTICFFIFCAIVWYNCASHILHDNLYLDKILFYTVIILSSVVLYLIIASINDKKNIKFMDRIRTLYKNKWLIILTALILIIPRSRIFALAGVSLQDPCYIPCVVFIVLATSIPVTWIVILSVSLYRKNSLKISILHATHAISQLNYIYFFSLIIITCLFSIMKIFIVFIIFPLYIIPNFDSTVPVGITRDTFKTYSPLEQGEGKGKGKATYDSDTERDTEFNSIKTNTASLLPQRERSVTPVNDPEEVAKAFAVMIHRQENSLDKDPRPFYNFQGRICRLTKAGMLLGRSNIPCACPSWANRAPFNYRDPAGWGMIKDVNNNIIGDIYEGDVRTLDGKLIGVKSWVWDDDYHDYCEGNIDPASDEVSTVVRESHYTTNYVKLVLGTLCREGHVHNDKGTAVGVLHSTSVYCAFGRHPRLSKIMVPANSNNNSTYVTPPNYLNINHLHKIGPKERFRGFDLETTGIWHRNRP